MNIEIYLSIFAFAFAATSIFFAFSMFKRSRDHRELLEFVEKQVEDLESLAAKNKETLESNAQRISEQARRIAWLETRVRQPKAVTEQTIETPVASEPQKLTMTERRHRVSMLAGRGHSAESIASTLGMLQGEVELIINLSQPINK